MNVVPGCWLCDGSQSETKHQAPGTSYSEIVATGHSGELIEYASGLMAYRPSNDCHGEMLK
jgi:hypothetical protein